ncbi:protein CDV3 homolog A [Xenopus laevis]|uniref:Protein CDV3 homolog A n=1 Tax=Xenopus laevis TaxID=8355 RepID=CDV3A_XENLA|nr:protein CDV3 homolog A [Xenopus laevis]Q7ZYA6.1 RecName: Full=Protein CDV3 homolog A [Xenopus laevis]AAH43870.1 Cdv3-prov protein [Xenopus laevis]
MAEPQEKSLDDFFAKRDKKKKKDKGVSGSAAGSRGSARPPDGAPSSSSSMSGAGKGVKKEKSGKSDNPDQLQEKEDDEWKEFEQKEVDYSGLRIQSLQLSNEKEDDENEKKEEQGADWEETGGYGTDKSSGPWNKTSQAQAPISAVTEAPEPVHTGGVYRPPAARASVSTRKPQGPPEIYSDTQFPSLQATAKHTESRREKEMEKTFEMVKHKNRARDEATKNQALRLQLDNQYAVLGEQ